MSSPVVASYSAAMNAAEISGARVLKFKLAPLAGGFWKPTMLRNPHTTAQNKRCTAPLFVASCNSNNFSGVISLSRPRVLSNIGSHSSKQLSALRIYIQHDIQ
jgi:hypothetical protein